MVDLQISSTERKTTDDSVTAGYTTATLAEAPACLQPHTLLRSVVGAMPSTLRATRNHAKRVATNSLTTRGRPGTRLIREVAGKTTYQPIPRKFHAKHLPIV